MFKRHPLPAGFMFVGIIGSIIFGIRLASGTSDNTWTFLMLLLCLILFIASVLSITPDIPKPRDERFQREVRSIKKKYGLIERPAKKKPESKKKTAAKKKAVTQPKAAKRPNKLATKPKVVKTPKKTVTKKPKKRIVKKVVKPAVKIKQAVKKKVAKPVVKKVKIEPKTIIKKAPAPQPKKEKKLLQNVKPEFNFVLHDGRIIRSLPELLTILKTISDDTFYYHVNNQKNDFKNWIRDEFNDKQLTKEIGKCTTAKQMIKAIKERLDSLRRSPMAISIFFLLYITS